MEEAEAQSKGFFDSELKLKEVIQFVGLVLTAVVFILTMNSKIDALTVAINELRDNDNKQSVSSDLALKALQNQVTTQAIQIQLLQKDVEFIKSKK